MAVQTELYTHPLLFKERSSPSVCDYPVSPHPSGHTRALVLVGDAAFIISNDKRRILVFLCPS